jgi:hypothetical protein
LYALIYHTSTLLNDITGRFKIQMKAATLALLLTVAGAAETTEKVHPYGASVRDLIGGHAPNTIAAPSFPPTPSIFSGTGITSEGASSTFGRSTGSYASSLFQGVGASYTRGEDELKNVEVVGSEMQRKRSSKFPWSKAPLGKCMNWKEAATHFVDPPTIKSFLDLGDNANCAIVGGERHKWCYLKDRSGESGGMKSNHFLYPDHPDMWWQYC